MIEWPCKRCGVLLDAPDSESGQTTDCPKCGRSQVIPAERAWFGRRTCRECGYDYAFEMKQGNQNPECPRCKNQRATGESQSGTWVIIAGAVVLALGLLSAVGNAGSNDSLPSIGGIVFALHGTVLLCTGLILRAIAKHNR